MIKVTRKNGNEILINEEHIKSIETVDDDITTIIFTSGYRLEVEESEARLLQYVRAFAIGQNTQQKK